MNRSSFSIGLLQANPEFLSSQLALWDNMRLWRIVGKKFDSWTNDKDALAEQIHIDTKTNLDKPASQLQTMLLFRISEELEINLPKRMTIGDLEDVGDAIESKSLKLLRNTDKEFTGSTTQDMAQYVLKKVFDDLSKKFVNKDAGTQDEIVQKILASIESMPPEQREKLRESLGAEELSSEAVRKAIVTGTLGAAFAIVIEVAGFSAYVFAVKALAAVTGLIGITLPFAAYTTLTSTIAVISNPLFLIPVGLGLGWWLTKRSNRKIKAGLIPVVTTQIVMQSMARDKDLERDRQFCEFYDNRLNVYKCSEYDKQNQLKEMYPGINKLCE